MKGKDKALLGPDDLGIVEDWANDRMPVPSHVSTTDSPFAFTSLQPTFLTPEQIRAEREAKLVVKSATSRDLFEGHQASMREDPIEFGKQLSAWASGSGWRAYNEYIGSRIFYEGYSNAQLEAINSSPQVTSKIREIALARLETFQIADEADRQRKLKELERQIRNEANGIAKGLVARMDSKPFLRFFGALVNNILVRAYHQGIHISLDEYSVFREAALEAAEKKQSLLILPCHKSHIDYLTVSWLFYRLGIALPHIVAGDNLNLPVVGNWLQKCGAFFIRRSFGNDSLYPTVVKEYIEGLLEQGHNIECFIEGSRSRTGKLLPPKLGILKYVVDAVQRGRAEDVVVCPISIQYDKVIETESYINELLGNPKEKETLAGLLLNTRVIQLKLGRIDVRFSKPFSLRGYMDDHAAKREASGNLLSPQTEQVNLLRSLGYQVLSDINRSSVIMPAALVGSVMLTIRGRGVGRKELIKRVNWLRNAIQARGGRVAEFAGMEVELVVDRALEVLKNLIGQHTDLIEPTFYPISRFELSFYRNQIMHLFVSEALLATTLYTRVKAGGAAPSQRMEKGQILDELSFISRLLQSEFVYGTEGLEKNAEVTIQGLEADEVILVEGDLIGLSPKERQTGRENFDFYCFLMWPFVETYWLAAVSLFALTPSDLPPTPEANVAWVAEREFHKSAQKLGKNLFYQGDISYLEAVNQATLSNAFLRMVELGIILTSRSRSKKEKEKTVPLMALHPSWVPKRLASGEIAAEGRLWNFLERLGNFRREGKNRRDSSTVSTRVFEHCSAIAPPVLEWSAFKGFDSPVSDFWAPKPNL